MIKMAMVALAATLIGCKERQNSQNTLASDESRRVELVNRPVKEDSDVYCYFGPKFLQALKERKSFQVEKLRSWKFSEIIEGYSSGIRSADDPKSAIFSTPSLEGMEGLGDEAAPKYVLAKPSWVRNDDKSIHAMIYSFTDEFALKGRNNVDFGTKQPLTGIFANSSLKVFSRDDQLPLVNSQLPHSQTSSRLFSDYVLCNLDPFELAKNIGKEIK